MRALTKIFAVVVLASVCVGAAAGPKHAQKSEFPSYEGLVMAGYQGWFHNPGGGDMYSDPNDIRIDMWPDVSEYEKTYPTAYRHADGSVARFFCSDDESTVKTHFKWMKQYGVDGVFLQRFFGNAMPRRDGSREGTATVIRHAMKYAQAYHRAYSVMYDLSGLQPGKDDCTKLIDDWKFLVDSVGVTNYGRDNMYLYHNGKPLVVIWGVGFPDRPYNIRDIKLDEFMDFLHNDPVYGGCTVMLGIPTYWRTLEYDCVEDEYLHTLIRQADLILPWMVQRFTPLLHFDMGRYRDLIRKDMAWCAENGVEYVPLIYPGFSWHNLSVHTAGDVIGDVKPVASIPRMGGSFYWDQAYTAISVGAKMLYVAMFDEVNEGTAIFKVTDNPPVSETAEFAGMDGMPSDHYLFLTGEIAKMLRGERPLDKTMPQRAVVSAPDAVYTNSLTDGMASNPFIKHIYTADPSAHVYNGRLYVYASHDIDPPRGCDLMDKYHIFSTDDMINWTDHGEILSAADVPWGRPEGGFMWAPDCAYANGKYYFYFPHPSESRWNDSWKIGVATSKDPASRFKVSKKYIKNVPPHIDPCVFIDDDGQAYLYVGGSAKCYGGKLKKNMVELDGEMVRMEGLVDFHEGTWVHKYNGKYYLSYPDNYVDEQGHQYNRLHYAMSDSPLGPWEYKGIFLDKTDCDTSHGSIVEFNGQWYAFYHGCQISQMGNLRSICFDKLFYNPDGTIVPVVQRNHCDLPRK